jgi:hypothetical protein
MHLTHTCRVSIAISLAASALAIASLQAVTPNSPASQPARNKASVERIHPVPECAARPDGMPSLCRSEGKMLVPRWSDGHQVVLHRTEGDDRLDIASSSPCLLWDKGTPREAVTCF